MPKEVTTIALEKIKPGSKRMEIPDGRVAVFDFVFSRAASGVGLTDTGAVANPAS
jgi:hypothetical protein